MQLQVPLVVFDFDWSLIDENSDPWVVKQLSPKLYSQMNELHERDTETWSQFMDKMMGKLWEEGFRKEKIKAAFDNVPIHPDMISAVKLCHSHNAELVIMSAANEFFIETILENYGLRPYFSRIHTHSVQWQEDGRMRVVGCHRPSITETREEAGMTFSLSHSCKECPADLCKGTLLDSYLATNRYGPVFYIGDSTNDFCPCKRLRKEDKIFARKDYRLHKLVAEKADRIPATVYPWANGKEVLETFSLIFS